MNVQSSKRQAYPRWCDSPHAPPVHTSCVSELYTHSSQLNTSIQLWIPRSQSRIPNSVSIPDIPMAAFVISLSQKAIYFTSKLICNHAYTDQPGHRRRIPDLWSRRSDQCCAGSCVPGMSAQGQAAVSCQKTRLPTTLGLVRVKRGEPRPASFLQQRPSHGRKTKTNKTQVRAKWCAVEKQCMDFKNFLTSK